MDNALSPADELVVLDRELAQLDARRSHLLARRAWLLSVLYAPVAPVAPSRRVAETAPRGAQNVLLTLGGVLLAVAAVAFTLVSWGRMGIGGRAAVLAVVTAGALAAPVFLLRRALVSTAEAVASLGLLLMVLDAYAVHRVALPEVDAVGYAAVASAVLAALWAAYGAGFGGLRLPLPAAVVAGQLPLPLGALAADLGTLPVCWALLVTAAADVVVALRAGLATRVRVVARVAAGATGGSAVLVAGWLSAVRGGAEPAGLLLVAAVSLPEAVALPEAVTPVVRLVVTAGFLGLAVRPSVPALRLPVGPEAREVLADAAGAGALLGGVLAAVGAWGSDGAAVAVTGVLGGLFTGAAVLCGGRRRTVAACAAVAALAGLVAAVAGVAGLPAHLTGAALLAVPVATAAVGAGLRRHPVAVPVELAGAAAGVLAAGLAATRPAFLALVLALCGVVAAATAVRPERRPAAGYAATALFVAATWVRLAASGVSAPEAYTLPVTVPALVVGVLRRRRDPEASSWTAYGPGLAASLVPSLAAAWGDAGWPRPLLLGLVALAVTLAGARLRLQAPLLLGGAVLALVALHELAPYVAQAVGALPRWTPPALAGLLLLAVGATYEQRLRDARRLRETVGRMR
ncbi:SCO7613 C-terminal domain-containing membrane protein [Streptomyces sp. WAC05374]|uniref:SCO7613 C-terminal domain-containing membrane protein n=1 Tax=Streptomyces sp. WAC05374 TaxID=2487420 RepID=UPI000F890C56|nr:hypothetical protein [Streptomyces sp. WAC05374]RST17314.1 hypothetical protein EF905_09925 [Streptomyces sp. WAC05374]